MFILLMVVCLGLWNGQQIRDVEWDRGIEMNNQELIDQVSQLRSETIEEHSADSENMVDEPKPVPSPSPSDKLKQKREIIIFMGVSCPPCDRWKQCEMQRFRDAGWEVAICDPDQHSHPRTPTFSITADGKTVERVGYFTFEQLAEVWK
jgi:hypothetical protein